MYSVVCVWVVVQGTHRGRRERERSDIRFEIGNLSHGRALNHPESHVCSVYCHERQSISSPGENPYLIADFQCDLELKCVNPGPEVVLSSFWKYCNGKGVEAVMDTQETPSGDLAAPA